MRHHPILLLIAGVAGCGSEGADPGASTRAGSKPPLQAGYRRFEAKPVPVAAGQTLMTVEWVAPAVDRDLDVLDIVGWQSKSGHHAILYATVDTKPVGTVRSWENQDQLSSKFIGGSGGDGGGQIKLPAGVVTRIPKGYGLILQLHFMNTSTQEVMGESLVDVKLADASPAHRVASFFTSTTLMYELQPQRKTSLDFDCKLNVDIPLLMYANHQHNYGYSAFTEQILPDGTRADIKRDDQWNYEWAFNPNYSYRPVDSPLILKAGTTLHTHCEWMNHGSTPVKFPDEMCVFLGFFLGDRDINCVDGNAI
jgi:hypothetical protein